MSGSDLKYRSMEHLRNTASWERRAMNTHKMRAEAAEDEIARREKAGLTCEDEGCPQFGKPHAHPAPGA